MVGADAPPAGLTHGGQRRVLATLCVTQVTSSGVLYYAFPVLARDITASTGWSAPTPAAGFSAAQLVSAVIGVPAGRWLDRHVRAAS